MGWYFTAMFDLPRVFIASVPRERGQTLAEYGLLLTLVAVGVITPTVILMRGALAEAFTAATGCMNGGC